MSSTDPDVIREQIERTRMTLSSDVDALAEKVTPARVVERRVEAARDAITGVKDKVMGAASDTVDTAHDKLSAAGSAVADKAAAVGDGATAGPALARRRARGNPLAAGLVAFGAGWLIASLLPASRTEQELASSLKATVTDHAESITGPLADAGHELVEHLQEPAQQAISSLKATASDGAAHVQQTAADAAWDLNDQVEQSRDHLTTGG